MKAVYAVVVNFNGWRDTLECLESLLRCDYPALRIVVCDNGSSDGSVEQIRAWGEGRVPATPRRDDLATLSMPPVAKPLGVLVVTRSAANGAAATVDWNATRLVVIDCGANLGFAGGNNVGMQFALASSADAFVWLINNDTVVAPGALSAMVRAADEGTGAVGATLLRYYEPDRIETLGGGIVAKWSGMSRMLQSNRRRSEMPPTPPGVRMNFVTGCCMLVSHDTLRRVGLLDERYFMYCEDADWSARMTAAGLRLAHSPDAVVWHKGGASAAHRSPVHDYHCVKSALLFVSKHRPYLLPLSGLYLAARFGLPKVVRGQWRRLGVVWDAYRDFAREAVRRGGPSPVSREYAASA